VLNKCLDVLFDNMNNWKRIRENLQGVNNEEAEITIYETSR
jgi:hypothetical protein